MRPCLYRLLALPIPLLCFSLSTTAAPVSISDEEIEVAQLIESLLDVHPADDSIPIDTCDFPPVGNQPKVSFGGYLQDTAIQSVNPSLNRLVELGYHALPALLKHLDDERATKLGATEPRLDLTGGPGGYLDYRRGNDPERKSIEDAGLPRDNPGPDVERAVNGYTLTVGDLCFVLTGMITNRSYYAIVYQYGPQLNSPTQHKVTANALRLIWGQSPQPVDLYKSLKADLDSGEEPFATGAAIRLAYYFPGQSSNLLRAHLRNLISAHKPGNEDLATLLAGISGTQRPELKAAIRSHLLHSAETGTIDARQFTAGAPAFADASDPKRYDELGDLCDLLKVQRGPAHVDATRALLDTALKTFPGEQIETIERFLENAGPYACITCLEVCEKIENPPAEALVPLLGLQFSGVGGKYLIKGEGAEEWPESDDYLTYRICDRAYEALARILGDTRAKATGSRNEMDTKIEALSKRLAGDPTSWPFLQQEIENRQRAQTKRSRKKSGR